MLNFSVLSFCGGITVIFGAVLGDAAANPDVGQTSFVIVLGGAITAAAAVAQKWMEDRKNAREIDLARRKVEIRTDQHTRVNVAQYRWMLAQQKWSCRLRDTCLKLPGAPEIDMPPSVPELPDGYLRSIDGDDDA
jgi:5-bromo-4-chloroindolyl phosphate hydrolysis protein